MATLRLAWSELGNSVVHSEDGLGETSDTAGSTSLAELVARVLGVKVGALITTEGDCDRFSVKLFLKVDLDHTSDWLVDWVRLVGVLQLNEHAAC